MRSHPMSEKADHDRMSELEVRMADATNLAGVEKIPQVGLQINTGWQKYLYMYIHLSADSASIKLRNIPPLLS